MPFVGGGDAGERGEGGGGGGFALFGGGGGLGGGVDARAPQFAVFFVFRCWRLGGSLVGRCAVGSLRGAAYRFQGAA